VGRAPRWALLVFGGGRICMRDILILNEILTQDKIYICMRLLGFNYFTYHSVPVLAPNYKQHILSPAKVNFLSVSQHAY
jgi:hypothetical protein